LLTNRKPFSLAPFPLGKLEVESRTILLARLGIRLAAPSNRSIDSNPSLAPVNLLAYLLFNPFDDLLLEVKKVDQLPVKASNNPYWGWGWIFLLSWLSCRFSLQCSLGYRNKDFLGNTSVVEIKNRLDQC
jgi:hypothetical protein